MKAISIAASLLITGFAMTPAAGQDYEKCSITPVDQVGFVETFTAPQDCEAECQKTDGCDSWSFLPHSFDKSMPGQCKLIKGVFKKEASQRGFCGKV